MKMTRITALLTVLLALAIAAFALVSLRGVQMPGAISTGTALVGGPFSLTDQKGARVSDADFRGKYMLVFFGYTSCPDVCPATLQVITAALEQLGDKARDVVPVFITVDPERDSVPVMADYLSHFDPRFVGLTGSPEEIAAAARAYRVYYSKLSGDNAGLFDHSSIIYLMGRNGEFLKHFTYTTDPDALAKGLGAAIAAGG